MKSVVNHIKLNVVDLGFFRKLFEYLEFDTELDFENGFGVTDGSDLIFVFKTEAAHVKDIDFKDTGLNHLAFEVSSREDVDRFYQEFLLAGNVPTLHEPREYSEYNQAKGYYAIFF